MISALLQSNGFEVRHGEPRRFDTGILWITENTQTARQAVEQFLVRSGGRAIVLDPSAQDWSEFGAIVIKDPDDFESVRDTIIESMSHVTGKGP